MEVRPISLSLFVGEDLTQVEVEIEGREQVNGHATKVEGRQLNLSKQRNKFARILQGGSLWKTNSIS